MRFWRCDRVVPVVILALAPVLAAAQDAKPPQTGDRVVLDVGLNTLLNAAFVQNGKALVMVGNEGKLQIWDTDRGTLRGEAQVGRKSNQHGFQFLELPDGKRVVAAGNLEKAYVISLEDAKVLKEIAVAGDYPASFALVDQGATLVRLDRTLTFRHYDVESGKLKEGVKVAEPPAGAAVNNLARLALAPDGKSYAINTGQCVVRDAATHEVRYTLKPDGKHEYQYRNGPYPPLYSADGKLVALHGVDGTLRVVDVASGKEVRTLRLEEREPSRPGVVRVIAPLAFSPNGRWLLVSTEGMLSELILFGVASGLEVRRFPGKVVAPGYGNMAISPAGNLLAVPGGSFDKVEIWDMEQGQVKLKAAPGK